jgi:hypothetical protein
MGPGEATRRSEKGWRDGMRSYFGIFSRFVLGKSTEYLFDEGETASTSGVFA